MNFSSVPGLDPANTGSSGTWNQKSGNHWKDIVDRYEKKNAFLEKRQAELSDRLQAMECALPSVLMSAMVSMHYGTDPPKIDLQSILSKAGGTNITRKPSSKENKSNTDPLGVELVYKRTDDALGTCSQRTPESTDDSRAFGSTKNLGNSGDDGNLMNPAESGGEQEVQSPGSRTSLSVMSSKDLAALSRIQELAEQERLLKRYICDLEDREHTFLETLERANDLLNDPLAGLQECDPNSPNMEHSEPLSEEPIMQRLQKLEFYNKRMIMSMRGLRQEKNVLTKQTEMLKAQLRSTQEKLGEVQKKLLGEDVNPVIGEPSFTALETTCSCSSTLNKGTSTGSPKTLIDLAAQFEGVLEKSKSHGLCKLSGSIKDAVTKLKELSKTEEGHKRFDNSSCNPTTQQLVRCPGKLGMRNKYQEDRHPWSKDDQMTFGLPQVERLSSIQNKKSDLDELEDTDNWFCNSCKGECICDMVSLDDDTPDDKKCECGCQNDRIPCECGCGHSGPVENEVGEAGDLPKLVARKVSQEFGEIICKDCGKCKCGDDHSKLPNCIGACKCSHSKTRQDFKFLSQKEKQRSHKEREIQPPNACGPSCSCSDAGNADPKLRSTSGPPKSCNVGFKEESPRLKHPKTAGDVEAENVGNGDESNPPNCPCSCNEAKDQCLCGCGVVNVKTDSEVEDKSCRCGCSQIVGLSDTVENPECKHKSLKSRMQCDDCSCMDFILELLKTNELAQQEPPETCPCTEATDVRKPEMEDLAETLQQEANSIARKNQILQQLLTQCVADDSETMENFLPTQGCPYHDPAPIRPTISGIQAAVKLLHDKSRSKDGMIAILAENLRGNMNSERIMDKLAIPTLSNTSLDFDECKLYDYLQRTELNEDVTSSSVEAMHPNIQEARCSDVGLEMTNSTTFEYRNPVPAPLDFRVVQQICDDCLLVAWTPPKDISAVTGYELLVNGYFVSRIIFPTRTEALLVSLDLSHPVFLTIYSLGPGRSSSEPVRITYPTCPCVND